MEVLCFTKIGVNNPHALDIRLYSQNGDVLIVQRGGDEHLQLIELLIDVSSVPEEDDPELQELLSYIIAPVFSLVWGNDPQ